MTSNAPLASAEAKGQIAANDNRTLKLERLGILYARFALGAAFLSGIGDRFGLYTGRNVGYGDFAGFEAYTAKVNSFMPASTIPFLAWAATVAEFSLGVALILEFGRAGWRSLARCCSCSSARPWQSPSGLNRRWITRCFRLPPQQSCSRCTDPGPRSEFVASGFSLRGMKSRWRFLNMQLNRSL